MAKYVRLVDAPEGKLTVNTKEKGVVFLDGLTSTDNATFEELKAYHGEDRFELDEEAAAKAKEATKKQYEGHKSLIVAEALNDAIVNEGINTTAPPTGATGAFETALSPDEQSPTVVAIEQEALSGEYEEEQERDAKKAETRQRAFREQEEKSRKAMLEHEAVAAGIPSDEFEVGAVDEPATAEADNHPGDHSVTDTQKKQAAGTAGATSEKEAASKTPKK